MCRSSWLSKRRTRATPARADSVMDSMMALNPRGIDGYMLMQSAETTPASKCWLDCNHGIEVEFINGRPEVKVTEVAA